MTDLPSWGVTDEDAGAAAHYRRFAEEEAARTSPRYAEWASAIADDPQVLALIDDLPREKRQANLVFAAIRAAGVDVGPWPQARLEVIRRWPHIREIALTHATQTNEAARCAVLLPALAQIDGPVALLEVGAAAGLCLFPDRYTYRYAQADGRVTVLQPDDPSDVVIDCELHDAHPPTRLPDVVWRAGIDLNPLDVRDSDTLAWLEALIWPEHDDRRERLRAAAAVAASDPPAITAGDLNATLAEVAASAPSDATLVVLHTAVLAYLPPDEREAFADLVTGLDAVWISNESAGVFPRIAERLPEGTDADGAFVLSVDGEPVGLTQPHGRWFRGLRGRTA